MSILHVHEEDLSWYQTFAWLVTFVVYLETGRGSSECPVCGEGALVCPFCNGDRLSIKGPEGETKGRIPLPAFAHTEQCPLGQARGYINCPREKGRAAGIMTSLALKDDD